MIQRLQTVFLALAVVLNIAVFFTPIFSRSMEDPQLWIGYGLTAALAIASLLSIYSILLFNDRKSQMNWVKRAALAQVIAIGFCVGVLFSLGGIGTYLWDEALGTGFAGLAFIMQMLALRFINKDEKLVRSMDRIR